MQHLNELNESKQNETKRNETMHHSNNQSLTTAAATAAARGNQNLATSRDTMVRSDVVEISRRLHKIKRRLLLEAVTKNNNMNNSLLRNSNHSKKSPATVPNTVICYSNPTMRFKNTPIHNINIHISKQHTGEEKDENEYETMSRDANDKFDSLTASTMASAELSQ